MSMAAKAKLKINSWDILHPEPESPVPPMWIWISTTFFSGMSFTPFVDILG
jgi:hypothetical protein